MTRRFTLACALAMGLLTAVGHGQQTAEQSEEQQPPVFRTGTELVRVDVSVLDRGGNPIRSLTADDFELRENGELQAITSFRLVEASGEPTDDLSLPIRSTHHAAAEAARDDVRVFLIFWDEYHIEQFSSAMRAREQLTRFVLESFGPTDLVGIMDQLTPMSAIRFTRDRRALAEAVHLLKGRRGVYIPTRSAVEDAHLRNAQDIERIRGQVTASALRSAVMYLGTMRQGRKAIIFVSESLGRLGQDGPRMVSDLIRTANDNNTAIYTVDPRGLQAASTSGFAGMSSLLAALASATGAEAIVSNDMSGALRRVVSHSSAFYLIGYAPTDSQPDGKFREINVRVRQPGVQVRARNGYWAPRASDVERARALAVAAAMPSPVSLALRELAPDNSRRAADFWIGQSPARDGTDGVEVRIAWAPRPAFDERVSAAAVSVSATSGTETLFEGPIDAEGGVAFRATPGALELDFTIHDETGETIDREQREMQVEDPGQTVLALATPVVSRARNAAEFRSLSSQSIPLPYAGREFSRTDRLLVRGVAYGAGAAGAEITAQLVGPRGSTLAELPIRTAAGPGGYVVDLPLTSLATGEFLIAIAARTASDRVETFVPLRIRR
jgi:VWFA-related protein